MRLLILALFATCIVTNSLAASTNELTVAEKAFSDLSIKKGSGAAYLAYLAEDGTSFGAGSANPIYGRQAFAASVASGASVNPPGSSLSWIPRQVRESADGSVGWVDGTWQYLGPPDTAHKALQLSGHYLRVWTKDNSGRWKIESDMATNDFRKP
jgi:ketosteroid isomerase-like protein